MICGRCETENEVGRKFCAECGSPLAMVCQECGAANRPTDKFCGECGSGLAVGAPRSVPGPQTDTGPPLTSESARERRVVSVLFADLVGFTSFSESRDPEDVRDLLSRYYDTAREIIERFGGVVEKFIGDAVMGVWGATAAQEDDSERAVRTGLELVETVAKLGADAGVSDLQLRVGIQTGEAAVGPGDDGQGHVVGDIVNTASRLQTVAPPGTVLVGESTYRSCEKAIAFESTGGLELKGKSELIQAWRALHVLGMRGGQRRGEGLEAPFVGREEELRLLKDQLVATGREGRSRLVSIAGIAGIGKSRIVWEFLKYVDGLAESVYWHEGRSPAYGEGIAFWALAEMVRERARIAETDDSPTAIGKLRTMLESYIPEDQERSWLEPRLAGLLGLETMPAGERGELFSAFRRLFERISERGTTVLVFEDLHWADAGLLDFVEELTDWSRDRPILVIVAARPELLDRRPTWGGGRRNFMAVSLGPLGDEAMRALITGLVPGIPDDAAHLVETRAAGIPLYAVELIRMLLLEDRLIPDDDGGHRLVGNLEDLAVPDSLHAVIGARLDRLDPDDRALIQDAAVLGQTFTESTLAALSGRDKEDLAQRLRGLIRKELLTFDVDPRSPERGQYGFVQSLIREVAYNRLSRQDRRDRHLAVAGHFEDLGDAELAGIVADHYLNALSASPGDAADTELHGRAVTALRRAAERAAALHSHEEVLGYCEQALELLREAPGRAEWWERAARAAHAMARFDEAVSHAQRLVDSQAAHGDASALLHAQLLLGRIYVESHQSQRALDLLEPVAAAVDQTTDDPDTTALVGLMSRAHLLSGNVAEAAAVAERAILGAERQENYPVLADALITRGTALGDLGRLHEGVGLLRIALEIAQDHDLALTQLRAHGNLSYVLGADDPDATMENLEAGLEHARQLGEFGWMLFFAHNYLGGLFQSGRWGDAERVLREFEDREISKREQAAFTGQRAVLTAFRDDPEEGLRLLDSVAAESESDTDPQGRRAWYMQRTIVTLAAGDVDTAHDLAMETIAFDTFAHPAIFLQAGYTSLVSGDERRLSAVLEAIDGLPRPNRVLKAVRTALAAALAMIAGEEDTASAEIDRLDEIIDLRFPVMRGILLTALGQIASGRHPAAEALAVEGRTLLEQIGATAYLARHARP